MEITINNLNCIMRVNRKNEIEIVGQRGIAILDEERNCICYSKDKTVSIKEEEVSRMKEYRENLRGKLKKYYMDLLSGKEDLMIVPTGDPNDYPNLITSETLLENGHESEKYAEVLESLFYPRSLEKIGVTRRFNSFHDVQLRSGNLKVDRITLRKLIKELN